MELQNVQPEFKIAGTGYVLNPKNPNQVINPENGRKSFDTRVHIRDPKTGKLIKTQPYKKHVREGVAVFERGGQYFYEDGEPVKSKAAENVDNAHAKTAQSQGK